MSSMQQRNRGRDSRNAHQRNRSGPNRSKHGKGSNRSRHPRARHNNNPRHQRREPANTSNDVSSAPPGLAVVEETNLPPIDEQRQIYAYTRCVGMHCEVEKTGGRTLSGIFHTAHVGAQSPSPQSISLQMLQDMQTGEVMDENEHFILDGDTWVQMRVPGLNLLKQDKKANAKSNSFGTDAEISGRTQIQERTLKTCDWLSGAESGLISGLEDNQDPMAESGAGVGKWDQFEANKDLKVNDVTYNENTMTNFYTTSLQKSGVSAAKRMEVERIAQEIEKSKAMRPVDTRDDEDRYSAVQRPALPPNFNRGNVKVDAPGDLAPAAPATAAANSEVTETDQNEEGDGSSQADRHQQVSTNTRAGLAKFQAECERQRKEESTQVSQTEGGDAVEAAEPAEASETSEPAEVSEPAEASEAVVDTSGTESPPAESEKHSEEDQKTESKETKPKAIVLKANAPTFTFKPNAPAFKPNATQPQVAPPIQTMSSIPAAYNYQQSGYPTGAPHYAPRGPYVPHAGHRPPLFPQQRGGHAFHSASRVPNFAPPRGYPPHNFMHNSAPRPHAMAPGAMHPRHRMGYSAGRGTTHNRNAMGGMHRP